MANKKKLEKSVEKSVGKAVKKKSSRRRNTPNQPVNESSLGSPLQPEFDDPAEIDDIDYGDDDDDYDPDYYDY